MNKLNAAPTKPQTLGNDILMRSIKILDIGIITMIYFGLSLFFSTSTDKFMGKFDKEKESKKSKLLLTFELMFMIWMYGVLIYVVRNIVWAIPFPLDGFHGFEHHRVKELESAMVFTFTFVFFTKFIKFR